MLLFLNTHTHTHQKKKKKKNQFDIKFEEKKINKPNNKSRNLLIFNFRKSPFRS